MIFDKNNIRIFLLLSILVLGVVLYNLWQQEHVSKVKMNMDSHLSCQEKNEFPHLPTQVDSNIKTNISGSIEGKLPLFSDENLIHVQTDVMKLKIDRKGGDVVYTDLIEYPQSLNEKNGFMLLNNTDDKFYIAQSGLLREQGPDSMQHGRAIYKSDKTTYKLEENILNVDLHFKTLDDVGIVKRFTFTKGSHVVDILYQIDNKSDEVFKSNFYCRLRRTIPQSQDSVLMGTMKTYTGAAVTTPESKYLKVPFDEMAKSPFKKFILGGWAAMVEHYFIGAWIPKDSEKHFYQSEIFPDNSYAIGFVGQTMAVKGGEQAKVEAKLYLGPCCTDVLSSLAPGLNLTVDYGVLWWICQPLFFLLKWFFYKVGNWGWAIILITVMIKLVFYRLSASSYRSMGLMRKLQPRIEALKERHGDNRQKFGQAVMGLYKSEKVNPLGGCLPIVIQIPVFISLYYVLLESVELRLAPFIFWIHDLSAKDPFYVLPLIMGISMFLQQKMNPTPHDPLQAKVMMFMPFVFTVLFLQFPSGLVLYWVVNNGLSILQQWYITRQLNIKQ